MGNWFLSLLSTSWAADLRDDLKIFLLALFAITGVLATGYSIYLGFLLAKAKDQNERQTAKKRIFSTVAGLVIIVLLTISFVGLDLSGFPNFNPNRNVDDEDRRVIPNPPIEPDIDDNTQQPGNPNDEDDDDEEKPQYPPTEKIEDCYYDLAYPLHLDSDADQDASFRSTIIRKFDEDDHPAVDFSADAKHWSTFTVHAIADGTVTKMVTELDDDDNDEYSDLERYIMIRHDKTIHSHNVYKRTVRAQTGITPERGPAPAKPRLMKREVRPEDDKWHEDGEILVGNVSGKNVYIWKWKYYIGREVWSYAHTIYGHLGKGSFNEQLLKVGDHVDAGQFIGFAATDYKDEDDREGREEPLSLHIELVLYGDDTKSKPDPDSIPRDEGRVDVMLYTKSRKTEIPVPAYEDDHWTDGEG